jgi:hypothetical protein
LIEHEAAEARKHYSIIVLLRDRQRGEEPNAGLP